ncbi:MAG: methyltransferase regulatory domain-containing protein [Pyrinomonadaceae bacterium]
MSAPAFSYDEVPYSSFTFPQTRPDRLATLGAFHGMEPAAPEKCRVLELGCGDGTNLISFAYILPDSEFVGIDLAKVHINAAERTAEELKLNNLSFLCDDVMNFTRERFGEFDYIIAHGLFSWVPDGVREKILEIYAECLAPQGVGYISYNAYPGCKTREMLWDMMKYYTAEIADPMQKVAGAIQYLNFLNFAAEKDTAYQTLINAELAQCSQRTPENIFHDDLSSMNRPFYFHEFVKIIKPHGLQFLSEVDAYWAESNLRPEIAAKIDELGDDIVRREQFTDFIRGRPFRSSLVCRADITLDRSPTAEILRSFYVASQVEPQSEDLDIRSGSAEKFEGLDATAVEVAAPLTKAALVTLQDAWSSSLSFDELVAKASELAGPPSAEDIEATAAELLGLFKKGFVYLHRYRPAFAAKAGSKPRASRFVQWQIRKNCADITALSGMNLRPEGDPMRLLLLLCDGTRDRDALVKEFSRRIEFKESEREQRLQELPAFVEGRLALFAKLGLLHD